MTWLQQMIPFIDAALLIDQEGQVVGTYRGENVSPSTLENFPVVFHNVLKCLGDLSLKSMHLVTHTRPVQIRAVCSHYLVILAQRDAPRELLSAYLENLEDHVDGEGLHQSFEALADIDRAALVDSVRQWLHEGDS